VGALDVPIPGVISDAQVSPLQAVAELWPATLHQRCQFHAIKESGRRMSVLDHRIKKDMRIRMRAFQQLSPPPLPPTVFFLTVSRASFKSSRADCK
jgi:hypothetical protein